MYVNLKQFNREEDNTRRAEQLALENARQAERDGWDRQNQAELAGQRQRAAELRAGIQRQSAELDGAMTGGGYDISDVTGGMARPSVNRQALDAYTPEQGAPALATGLTRPAAFQPPAHMQDEMRTIRGRAQLAGLAGDPRMLMEAQNEYAKHQKQVTAARLINHLDGADDAEWERIASTITKDKTNKIKAKMDKKTGYFMLETEEGDLTLNRKEMRDYLVGKATGRFDEMSKAQESAQGRSEKEDGRNVQMVGPNNTGIHYANQDAKAAAGLAIQRERAGAAAKAEKMGLVRQYSDPKTGEIKEMYPVTGRDGKISWEEVPTPEGMAPYRAPKPFSPKEYADTIKASVDSGIPVKEATMMADQLYGRVPAFDATATTARLRAMEEAKKRGGAPIQYGPNLPATQAIPMHILREAGGDANRARAMMHAADMQALEAMLSQRGRGLSTMQRPPAY